MAEEGRITMISSSTTALALPGYVIYDVTKGVVEQFTRILAKDFGSRGIMVNTVSRGVTETETYRKGKRKQVFSQLGTYELVGLPRTLREGRILRYD